MSIHLILVDAEIEALPSGEIGSAPRTCCMPGADGQRISILDSFLHRDIVSSMPDRSRRGRPDIAHAFLLMALGSAHRAKGLEVLVHTREDVSMRFAPGAKVSRDYVKFLAMMTELFERGHVGSGEQQITVQVGSSLLDLLESEKLDFIIAMSPIGRKEELGPILNRFKGKEVGILIGGFPEGDYLSPVYDIADMAISLGDMLLTVPEVTAQVLAVIP